MNSQVLASGLLIAAIFLASLHSNAQGGESTISEADMAKPQKNILLSVDIAPILLGGFGLGADGKVSEKISLGAFYDQTQTNNDDISSLFSEAKLETKTYGIRGRLYLNRTFSESGWYLGAALAKTDLKVKARWTFLYQGPEAEGKKEQIGGQGSLGYQFIGRKTDSGQFSFNLAYIYGAGNKFGYEYSSQNGVATVDPILENGSSAEATLGWMF